MSTLSSKWDPPKTESNTSTEQAEQDALNAFVIESHETVQLADHPVMLPLDPEYNCCTSAERIHLQLPSSVLQVALYVLVFCGFRTAGIKWSLHPVAQPAGRENTAGKTSKLLKVDL